MTSTDISHEIVYDGFEGPTLDMTRWFHLAFPLPDGTTGVLHPAGHGAQGRPAWLG
ncbi:hypothetical protein ABZ092_01610 [Streptomyces bobili]|uniref:hypothetical protein n=1 Tax=Streptomyces bobili TaxID=67280 RepID=UPI0033B2A4AC